MNDTVAALKQWLDSAQAQHLPQFAAHTAMQYSKAVEYSHVMAHHPCTSAIREQLQQLVDLFQQKQTLQSTQVDELFKQCVIHEPQVKQLMEMSQNLRVIVQQIQADLENHQTALNTILPDWVAQARHLNPLDDQVARNDMAQRRLVSIAALIQSCESSMVQLSLMYNQMSRLCENLTTLRQVTYPIWQQGAINRTMQDDVAFLESLQQTLLHTGEIQA